MFHIRTTKTASSAIAVQVVRYLNRKMIVESHFGSAHNKEELLSLKQLASDWIKRKLQQQSLFNISKNISAKFLPLNKCQYLGIYYSFIYEILAKICYHFQLSKLHNLDNHSNHLLIDLVLMRIIEPVSKLQSLERLSQYFGIKYERRKLYRFLPKLISYKNKIESMVLAVAKKDFDFNFSLVFYDVTTLYFESFKEDELRKNGFSKDNKPQQPQILIGLVVNTQGFPIAYEIFEGSEFEGHTLIPVISIFKRKHHIKKLTVVADAAMISFDNIQALKASRLNYIVGARIKNLSKKLTLKISNELPIKDQASIRIKTDYGNLICDFSQKRYLKDKNEMEKQLQKAKDLINSPTKIKRAKFLKNKSKTNFQLNSELIKKTTKLLGIKGYYTNLPEDVDNAVIINHYHSLWHVEQSFRIAKSDLQMRPIYHFKKHTIEAHILICFLALAICKYMELKTGKSTKAIIELLKSVTDARILNTITNEVIIMRSELTDDIKQILQDLDLSY